MKKLIPKISIIGCGNVGMEYAYAIIIKGLVRELILVDADQDKAEGNAMDLSHGAPYINPVQIEAGDYPDIADSDLIVITVGSKQKPGESRIDLVKKNAMLFTKIIPEINEISPDSIILIASNPVDVLSHVSYKLSGKHYSKVFGSGTSLDTARFRFILGEHCNVNPKNVHAYILGEHGDSEFAVWSSAMIGGTLFDEYCHISNKNIECDSQTKAQLVNRVRNSAYKIIEKKGETSFGIGLALAQITKSIVNDENTILPVSTLIQDYLGVEDIFLSLPTIINGQGISSPLKIQLNTEEKSQFTDSANKIRKIIDSLNLD
jgi:L-lactate dehydrogenase